MNKKCIFNLLLVSIIGSILILSGCQLAKDDLGLDAELEVVDEFRGFHITVSSLNITSEESDNNSNRIWGEIIESDAGKVEIRFPGTDGMNFFYATIGDESDDSLYRATFIDEKIADGEFKFLEKISIQGNIYILSSKEEIFYANPVYQTSKGKLYVVPAEMGVKSSQGANANYFMEFAYSKPTEESESDEEEISINIRADLNFIPMDYIEKYVFLYMGTQDNVLETLEVSDNNQFENLTISSEIEYIIVQIHHVDSSGDSYVTRELLEKNKTSYMTKFFNDGDLATSDLILLIWE